MSHNTMKFAHKETDHFEISVKTGQQALQSFMEREGIDCIIISSQDAFLSEYNSLRNSHRYAVSGFKGSTGDGIFFSRHMCEVLHRTAPFMLFVDGRYHLQADKECDLSLVEVVKMGLADSQEKKMQDWFSNAPSAVKVFALDGPRSTLRRCQTFEKIAQEKGLTLRILLQGEVETALRLPGWTVTRPITPLPDKVSGRTLTGNIAALHKKLPKSANPEKTCILTATSDDAAWLLNARGFHMPYSSAILSFCFIIGYDVVLFLPEGPDQSPIEIPLEGKGRSGHHYTLRVVRKSVPELETLLKKYRIDTVAFNANTMNAFLPTIAAKVWPKAQTIIDFSTVETARAVKTEAEINSMKASFLKSSRSIAKTLRWLKAGAALTPGTVTSDKLFTAPISEKDVADKLSHEFAAEGAVDHSFGTIAATGENGAIIHYSEANPARKVKPGEIFLLDCGAYFEEGFATDTTRTVFCGAKGVNPEPWQKKIYTVTLKGALGCLHAEFDRTLYGNQIDLYARNHCTVNGYVYNHGTGHGIGIHVHEAGARISPLATACLLEHSIVSVEPGIYLEGKGGVRIENIAVVRAHKTDKKKFMFENICFVGYDWDLIDVTMLTEQEKKILIAYEKRCQKLGTSVTKCPLVKHK